MQKNEAKHDEELIYLYDLYDKLKNVHKEILDGDSPGYLCINEHLIDFKAPMTVIPIAIRYPDHIIDQSFVESTLVQIKYQNDVTIWDMLIRQGLINNTVEITNY